MSSSLYNENQYGVVYDEPEGQSEDTYDNPEGKSEETLPKR